MQKLAHLQAVREGGNIREMMFNLRSDLIRNVANVAKRWGDLARKAAAAPGLPNAWGRLGAGSSCRLGAGCSRGGRRAAGPVWPPVCPPVCARVRRGRPPLSTPTSLFPPTPPAPKHSPAHALNNIALRPPPPSPQPTPRALPHRAGPHPRLHRRGPDAGGGGSFLSGPSRQKT
jgi:hypothetical protein